MEWLSEIENLKDFDKSLSGHLKARGQSRDGKSSRYRGVTLVRGKWLAKITPPGGKQKYLGSFDSEERAATAYNIAAKALYGEDAFQNDICK